MPHHFFAIRALDPLVAQDDLNRFCAAHRVVSIERQWISAGLDSHWALCVVVASGPEPLPEALRNSPRAERSNGLARIDYKQVLSEPDFALFAELRTWRKTTAEHEGVPVYAVFTNEQLAEIVQKRVDSLAALGDIAGIGPARLERYGDPVLARLRSSLSQMPPA